MARFDGKVFLISGGARGQGAAEARALVAEGAKVVIGDVLEERGKTLAGELGKAAVFLRHDVTSEADWDRAVKTAEDMGGLNGLVNNAGIYKRVTMMDTDTAFWNQTLAVNQTGAFYGMKAAVPALERAGGGSIVNTSSTAGLRGVSAFAYVAAKWALRGMTKSAALDLAAKNIRVNSIHPGPISTDMANASGPERIAELTKTVPMRRMGQAEEIARLVVFLLSDESSYITGAEIAIDGGMSI